MKSIANTIREIRSKTQSRLMAISSENAHQKPTGDTWSKQEILGHLVNPADNNHPQVIRTAINLAANFPPHPQEQWDLIQAYYKHFWFKKIKLRAQINLHPWNVIDILSAEILNNQGILDKEWPIPLRYIIHHDLRYLKNAFGRHPQSIGCAQ